MNLFFKELKNELRPLKLLLYAIITMFIIGFYSIAFSAEEMSYSTLEMILVILLLTSTTSMYLRYRNEVFLKLNELNFYNKHRLKIILFLVLSIEGIVICILYFALFILAQWINLIDSSSYWALGNDGDLSFREIFINSKDSYLYLIYALYFEIIILIIFTYTLNHFTKNRFLLNGLIVLIIIYSMFFGNVIDSRIQAIQINGYYYLTIIDYNFRTLFNAIVMPWNQVGMIGKKVFNNSEYLQINWFDYSQMGIYSNLIWTPYLSVFIMYISTTIVFQHRF